MKKLGISFTYDKVVFCCVQNDIAVILLRNPGLACALLQELDVQLRDCREELFCRKEHLQALNMKEKDSIAQVSKSKSTIISLDNQLRKVEKELMRQQMTISGQAC